jgi:pyruvate dehydrogenase E1 component
MRYLHERRQALGGYLPQRRAQGGDELHGARRLTTFKARA